MEAWVSLVQLAVQEADDSKVEKEARLKLQIWEQVRAELSFEFDQKLARSEARIRSEMQQQNAYPAAAPRVEASPMQRGSSCASTVAAGDQAPVLCAVDHITVKPTNNTYVVLTSPFIYSKF